MKRIFVIATLLLGTLAVHAQEKVMNVQKKDGTSAQTRVADLSQINFLTVDAGDQGLQVKTIGGETAAVRFESHPVVTVSRGKLVVKSEPADTLEFEITDIAEILFGKAGDQTAITPTEGFAYVMQKDCLLLRSIPKGVNPYVYTIDGRRLPTPPLQGNELRLSRATLGKGIFIVKVGSFSAKISL